MPPWTRNRRSLRSASTSAISKEKTDTMPGKSWQIGRLAGIPIGVNPLWLVIVALITWSLGSTYYPDQVDGDRSRTRLPPGSGERAAAVRKHLAARARSRGRRPPTRGAGRGHRPLASGRRLQAQGLPASPGRRASLRRRRPGGDPRDRGVVRGPRRRFALERAGGYPGSGQLPVRRQFGDPRLQPHSRLSPRRGADLESLDLAPGRRHRAGDERRRHRRSWIRLWASSSWGC